MRILLLGLLWIMFVLRFWWWLIFWLLIVMIIVFLIKFVFVVGELGMMMLRMVLFVIGMLSFWVICVLRLIVKIFKYGLRLGFKLSLSWLREFFGGGKVFVFCCWFCWWVLVFLLMLLCCCGLFELLLIRWFNLCLSCFNVDCFEFVFMSKVKIM